MTDDAEILRALDFEPGLDMSRFRTVAEVGVASLDTYWPRMGDLLREQPGLHWPMWDDGEWIGISASARR